MTRKLRSLLLALLCFWMLALPAEAASSLYHTPAVTVITENAPRDLELMIRLQRKDGSVVPIFLEKKTKAWEQQFRLFREAGFSIRNWYGNDYDLEGAELVLRSAEGESVIPLTKELTDQMSMDDVLMLNYKTKTLSLGDPLWRGPLLLALRVLLAVALELLVFRLRGYSERRSYLTVTVTGLLAFGLLGWYSSGWLNFDIRAIIPYIILLFLAMTGQTLIHLIVVDEESKDHILVTTLLSYGLAALVNGVSLYFLPI